jgi:hypothetical protein
VKVRREKLIGSRDASALFPSIVGKHEKVIDGGNHCRRERKDWMTRRLGAILTFDTFIDVTSGRDKVKERTFIVDGTDSDFQDERKQSIFLEGNGGVARKIIAPHSGEMTRFASTKFGRLVR